MMPSEPSRSPKEKHHMIPLTQGARTVRFTETGSRIVGARGGGRDMGTELQFAKMKDS